MAPFLCFDANKLSRGAFALGDNNVFFLSSCANSWQRQNLCWCHQVRMGPYGIFVTSEKFMSSGNVIGLLAKLYNDKQNLAYTYVTLSHHTTIKLNVRSSKTCNFGGLDSIYLMTLKTTATLIFFQRLKAMIWKVQPIAEDSAWRLLWLSSLFRHCCHQLLKVVKVNLIHFIQTQCHTCTVSINKPYLPAHI